jgi:hypothetical protein
MYYPYICLVWLWKLRKASVKIGVLWTEVLNPGPPECTGVLRTLPQRSAINGVQTSGFIIIIIIIITIIIIIIIHVIYAALCSSMDLEWLMWHMKAYY